MSRSPRRRNRAASSRVLVLVPALVPSSVGQKRLAAPHPAEYAGVQLELVLERGGGAPLLGGTPSQRRLERQRDGPRDRVVAAGALGAADPGAVAALEPGNAVGDVIRGVHRVAVHPRRPHPARLAQRDVEPAGNAPPGVVEQADARVLARQRAEDLAGTVGGAAVGEHELERPVKALGAHRRHHRLDVALLVEDGDEDRAVHGRAAHGAPPRNRASRSDSASSVCSRA